MFIILLTGLLLPDNARDLGHFIIPAMTCQAGYEVDEGTGTVAYDSSGYGNNGTLYNGVSWSWESPFVAAKQ